ncbi:MAG: Zn-ribbon domain-containing OB-fold protein [Actinobacteria bacterium]|nr:Zn-ribbon domain-containing OB-fold protein [Actinomycetota bacterium]MBU1942115.1 Zn-ribbon domain-containing OB-fold protein [Actinomycetota bacterium]MBU2686701.1 Zn-ribbon domain-containing OB-fold protein [Actinomycetota bacterium]
MLEVAGGSEEPVEVVEGDLDIEYRYAYGEYYDRFYREMRDNRRIMGVACARCRCVLLPPRPYCGFCYEPVDRWVELADEGTVQTFTNVQLPFPGQPTEPPYIYAFIMLDGAAVQFPHLLGEVDPARARVGMRVKAVWAENRKGTLHDIKYFRPVENEG